MLLRTISVLNGRYLYKRLIVGQQMSCESQSDPANTCCVSGLRMCCLTDPMLKSYVKRRSARDEEPWSSELQPASGQS